MFRGRCFLVNAARIKRLWPGGNKFKLLFYLRFPAIVLCNNRYLACNSNNQFKVHTRISPKL